MAEWLHMLVDFSEIVLFGGIGTLILSGRIVSLIRSWYFDNTLASDSASAKLGGKNV